MVNRYEFEYEICMKLRQTVRIIYNNRETGVKKPLQ